MFKRSLRFSFVGGALLLLSSCAELLALLGLGGVVIQGNVTVDDGNPGGQSILVAVTTNIPGNGTVFFETQPEFFGNGDNAFYEIEGIEPGNYYVVAFLDDGDGQLDVDTDQFGCFPNCQGGSQDFNSEFDNANITIPAGGGGGGGATPADAFEPNEDQFSPADLGTGSVFLNGLTIHSDSDVDWFRVTADLAQLDVTTWADGGQMIDTVIWVYEEDPTFPGVLTQIAFDDDSGIDPLYSQVTNLFVVIGWNYYIEVREFDYPNSFHGNYALDIQFHP